MWLYTGVTSDWIAADKVQKATVPCTLTVSDESIDATGTGLTVGEAHVLAAWLKRSTTQIKSLTLAGNELSGAQRQESEAGTTWSSIDTTLSGIEALCTALNDDGDSVGIAHLDLTGCGLGAQSTMLIAKCLKTDGCFRRSVERIILDGNFVTDSRFRVHTVADGGAEPGPSLVLDQDVSALRALGQNLQYAPKLVALSLVDCHIGSTGLADFVDVVSWKTIALKSLELGGNPLGSVSESDASKEASPISQFCAHLARGNQLEIIGLDRIGCDAKLLLDFSEVLHNSSELKKVSLSGNMIGTAYTRPVEGVDVHVPVQRGCVAAYQNRFGEVMRDPDEEGEVKLRWLHSSAESEWINQNDLSLVVDSLSQIVSDYSHIRAFAAEIHSLEELDVSYCAFNHHAVDCLIDTARWTDAAKLKEIDIAGNKHMGDDSRGRLETICEQHSVQVDAGQTQIDLEKLAEEEEQAAAAFRVAAKLDEEARESVRFANDKIATAKDREQRALLDQKSAEAEVAKAEQKAAETEVTLQKAEAGRLAAEKEAAEQQARLMQEQLAELQLKEAQERTKPRHFHRVGAASKAQLDAAEKAYAQASTILDDPDGLADKQRAVDEAKEAVDRAKSSRARKQAHQTLEQCERRLEAAKKELYAKKLFRLQDQVEAAAADAAQAKRTQEEAEAAKKAMSQVLEDYRSAIDDLCHEQEQGEEMLRNAKKRQEAALQARIEADREGMKGLVLARQARKARERESTKLSLAALDVDYDDIDDLKVQCSADCLTGAFSTAARRLLTLFSFLLVVSCCIGLLCVLQLFDARVRGARESGALAYFVYLLGVSAAFAPVAGIYGAMQRIESLLRGCSFSLYVLVCGYLAVAAALMLETEPEDTANTNVGTIVLAFASAVLSAMSAYIALRGFCAWTFHRDDLSSDLRDTWMDHPKANVRRVNQVLFVSGWFGWFKAIHTAAVCLLLYNVAIESPSIRPDESENFSRMTLELFICFFMTSGSLIDVLMMPSDKRLFFKDAVTVLDFVCVLSSWFFFVLPQYGQVLALARCLRVIRPMVALAELESSLDEVHATTFIATAFKVHAGLHVNVVLFIVFSLLCCCIVTVNLYGGAIQYSCEAFGSISNATGYTCPSSLAQPRWWGTPPCDDASECHRLDPPRELLGGDKTGKRGFNSVPQAFMTLLVHVSGEGGMNDVPAAVQAAGANGSELVWWFFAVLIIVLHWVVLTMLLAMGVYTIAAAEQTAKDHARDAEHTQTAKKGKLTLGQFGAKESLVNFDRERVHLATSIEELDWEGSTCCKQHVGTIRNKIKLFAKSNRFRNMVVVMVLLWTGVLLSKTGRESATSAGDVDNWASMRQLLELVLLVGFVSEIAVKIVGFGARRFFKSFENLLDLAVCIFTCVGCTVGFYGYLQEIHCKDSTADGIYNLMPDANETLQQQDGFNEVARALCMDKAISESTLKFFRVMRIVQVARILYKQEAVNDVMIKAFSNWQIVLGVFACVAFLVALLSVIAMQLLAGSLGKRLEYSNSLCCSNVGGLPRSNFETFTNALMSNVQIMLNDGWKGTLMFYWERQGVKAALFVLLFLIGRGVLFNLLRAVMLVNFDLDEDLRLPKQMEKYWRIRQRLEDLGNIRNPIDIALARDSADAANTEESMEQTAEDLVELLRRHPEHADARSLWLFTTNGRTRLAAAAIETSSLFTTIQVLIISISMGWMAVKDEEQDIINRVKSIGPIDKYVEYAVLGIFAAEAVVKTISSGFVLKSGPSDPYLRVQHNVADFVILVTLFLTQFEGFREYCMSKGVEENHLQIIGGLGPAVGLMQLRQIRQQVNAFMSTLPAVATVCLPLLFVILGFSLAGVELFANGMKQCHCPPSLFSNGTVGSETVTSWQYCHDGMAIDCNSTQSTMNNPCNEQPDLTEEILFQSDCVNRVSTDGRKFLWQNQLLVGSFDDSMEASKALIKASTSSSTELLYALMDSATVKDQAPTANNSAVSASMFLLIYHATVTVFLLNLFFAVMGETFSGSNGSDILTLTGKRWKACIKTLRQFKPIFDDEDLYRPSRTSYLYRSRLGLFKLLCSQQFRTLSASAVVLNSVILASQHYPASEVFDTVTLLTHQAFVVCFIVEAALKVYAFGPRNYFGDPWLALDFLYIGISLYMPGMVFLKLLRCAKVFSHWSAIATLIELMRTAGRCLKNVYSIMSIMVVLIVFYAILGKQLYVSAESLADEDILCHFQEFVPATKCLFQIVTGEPYGHLIAELVAQGYDEIVATAYFFTFYVLTVFVCLNLVLVKVVDTFSLNRMGKDVVTNDDLWGFSFAWAHLTVGTHAVPAFAATKGQSFTKRLQQTVAEALDETETGPVTFNVHDIPESHASNGAIRRAFGEYGEIDDVSVRKLYALEGGGYFDAQVVYKDRRTVKMKELQAEEISLGDQVVAVRERRLVAQDLTAMPLPNDPQPASSTLRIRLVRATNIAGDVDPLIKLKCLHTAEHQTESKPAMVVPAGERTFDGSEVTMTWGEQTALDFHVDGSVVAFSFDLHDASDSAHKQAGKEITLQTLREVAGGEAAAMNPTGAETTLELMGVNGDEWGKLLIQVAFIPDVQTPDWGFASEFAADNAHIKPPHCGVAGWVQQKNLTTGLFENTWMYITMSPPELCMLQGVTSEDEIHSLACRPREKPSGEAALSSDAVGVPSAHVPRRCIIAYSAMVIDNIQSGCMRVRNKSSSSKQDSMEMHNQECTFEVAFSDEHDHKDTGHSRIASGIGASTLGVLRLTVEKARNLPPIDLDGETDAYVACQYGTDDSEDLQQYRTDTVQNSCSPKFMEAFCFKVNDREQPLLLTVCDENPESADDIIGKIEVDFEHIQEGQDQKAQWEPIKKVERKVSVSDPIATALSSPNTQRNILSRAVLSVPHAG